MKKRLLALLFIVVALSAASSCYLHSLKVKEKRLKQEELAWQGLKRRLTSRILAFKGEVGVVIEDLSSGRDIEINQDALFAAASMVKVPIMAAYFGAEAQGECATGKNFVLGNQSKTGGSGKLKYLPAGTQIAPEALIKLMISESDNTAANMLIESFGFAYLNRAFKQFGLSNTTLERKMMDFKDRKNGVENYTTASDTARLFKALYFGKLISQKTSQRCRDILRKQKINDRIPAYLPSDVVVAHKTGLEYGVCHDAGIVYTRRGDFLVCVLVKHNYPTARPAKRLIALMAKDVYDFAMAR